LAQVLNQASPSVRRQWKTCQHCK